MRYDFLLTKISAKYVINNTKAMITRFSSMFGVTDHSGILQARKSLFSRIDDCVTQYGEQVTGTALESVRSGINFSEPWLYYDAVDGNAYDDAQWDFVDNFLYDLFELSDKLGEQVEETEEKKKQEEEQKAQQQKEYKRLRSNLLSMIRRRKEFGISIEAPKIPKTITEGSLNQIKKTIAKVKSDYRYLVGRGYRKGK